MTEALACVVSTEQFWCKKVKQSRVPPKETVPGRVWGVGGGGEAGQGEGRGGGVRARTGERQESRGTVTAGIQNNSPSTQ